MLNFIKKAYIFLFTNNPYKVVPFNSVFTTKVGKPVGVPETLTSILIEEKGDLIFYPAYPGNFDQPYIQQKLNNNIRYSNGTIFKETSRYLYSIDSGHIIGLLGLVYDKKTRTFIDESAKLWTKNLQKSNYINFYNPPVPKYLPGVTLSCITIGADGGFYHFMHEVLPKLFFCKGILSHTDQILINGPAVNWKEKWLLHIGIDLNKVIWTDHLSHFKCKQLLFTNRVINDQQISNWSVNALRKLLNITVTPVKEKKIIWLIRKDVYSRIITWEDELLSLFPDIEKIDTRDMPVTDTIKTFANATHIIGAHGAGLSNLIMCSPDTKVLELYPNLADYQPCYFRISSLCGLEHFVAEVDFNKKAGMETCRQLLNQFI